jgi:hypothetical protein
LAAGRAVGSKTDSVKHFWKTCASWNEVGAIALKRAAEEDPVGYCKIIASLMPRDLNLNIAVDPTAFIETFRTAARCSAIPNRSGCAGHCAGNRL